MLSERGGPGSRGRLKAGEKSFKKQTRQSDYLIVHNGPQQTQVNGKTGAHGPRPAKKYQHSSYSVLLVDGPAVVGARACLSPQCRQVEQGPTWKDEPEIERQAGPRRLLDPRRGGR